MKRISVILFFFMLIFFTGCEEEKDDDIRDGALGTYQATWKYYELDGNTLYYCGF